MVVDGNNANNAITYQEGDTPAMVPSTAWGQVAVDASEPINFTAKTTLTINGLAGTDTISLGDPATPTGLGAITVNGNNPTGNDTLIVNGTAGVADNFVVIPMGVGTGTVSDTGAAAPGVTFTGIGNLSIVGQAGDADSLHVGDTAGNDIVQYTPGTVIDTGVITGTSTGGPIGQFSYTPITFSGISSYVMPISADGPQLGNDELIVNGLANTANNFTFTGAGVAPFATMPSIVVNGGAPIFFNPATLAANGIVLNAVGSGNVFNFIANTAEAPASLILPVTVKGSGQSIINFTAIPGAGTVVNYGAGTITSTGANNISFVGIGTINTNANGGTVLVDGTAGDDSLVYAPATATSGAISLTSSVAPIINFTGAAVGGLTIDPLGGSNTVTVVGIASNNSIVATAGATPTVQVNGLEMLKLVAADTQSLAINGGPGNDNLTVDSTAGAFSIPITYDGSSGDNSLTLIGGSALSDVYTATAGGSGSSVLTFAGPAVETVNFMNLAPVFDSVTATTLTVNAGNANTSINYTEGSSPTVSPSTTWGQVAVGGAEPINFINKTTLILSALGTGDTINLGNSFTPTGLTGITVTGSSPTANDALTVNGTPGQDTITYTPNAITAGAGTVVVDALPTVTFTGIGTLAINGQGGNDNLILADLNGSDAVTLTPGAAIDSGTAVVNRISGGAVGGAALSFTDLGATGSFTVSNSVLGSPDTLVYNGTGSNDIFNVAATSGQINLVTSSGLAQIPVNTIGVSNLVLNGLSGQNTFNIPAPQPYTSITLSGGSNGQSIANLAGNGVNITSTLGGTMPAISGGGLGTVTLSGIGVVNVSNDSGNMTFTGTAGLTDNIVVTPTGMFTATVQDNDTGPLIYVTTATGGTLTVGGNAGDVDTVTVNGTNSNDLITVTGTGSASNPVVALTVGSTHLQAVSVSTVTSALVINSGLGTDSVLVDSSVSAVTVPITFIGGGGADDSLTLSGGTATSDVYTPGSIPGSGLSILTFPSGIESVTFANLKPVLDMVASPLEVDGTSADDVINYTTSPTNTTHGYVSVNNAEPIEFTNKTILNIYGEGGDNTITIFNPNTPTGLTAINVNGASPSGSVGTNTLVVNANNTLFTSADINTASTTVLAVPGAIPIAINYANIANVHVINSKDTLTSVPVNPLASVAGVPLNNVVVASFKFTDQPPAEVGNPTDFLATIDWGDGTIANPDLTAGTVVELAPYNGVVNFQVLGTHTYLSQGPYTISVTIYDKGSSRTFTPANGSVPVTITANPGALTILTPITTTASVASYPITVTGAPTNQVAGITSTTLVATIVDPNPGASVANYPSGSISINWGDGTPVTDTSPPIVVTQVGIQANGVAFEVFAPHMYANPGNYTVTTTITRSTIINNVPTPGSSNVAVSNEIVSAAPLTPAATQPTVSSDEATTYPTPEFGAAPSNNPGQLFSGPVAYFNDANTQSPTNPPSAVSAAYQATIDWGDGTPQSAGTVSYDFIDGYYVVSGTHTYATSGVNGGVGHYPIKVYVTGVLPLGVPSSIPPSTLTVTNTANVTDNPIVTTGILNPSDDSGKSNSDDITNVAQPNFYGTVYATLPNGSQVPEPYAHVELYANGVPVGYTQAGSDGSWSITSNNLAQGTYTMTTSTTDQFGQTTVTGQMLTPHLVVDTTAPVITSLSFNRFNATLTVTFQDNLSGMDLASLTNSAFYHISAKPLSPKVHVPSLILPTSILYTPGASPTDPVTVYVVFNNGHVFRGGKYEVLINSGTGDSGIQDVAGNALDGNFYGSFPTGDGLPGGNFIGTISTYHRVVMPFVPTGDGYVPPVKGIDPPAGSGPGTGGKSHKVKIVHRSKSVVRQELTKKISARNAKLNAYDSRFTI